MDRRSIFEVKNLLDQQNFSLRTLRTYYHLLKHLQLSLALKQKHLQPFNTITLTVHIFTLLPPYPTALLSLNYLAIQTTVS